MKGEWQPIETAPKDDSKRILLAVVCKHPQQLGREADFYHLAFWNGEHCTPYAPNKWTHWMPLPEPPK